MATEQSWRGGTGVDSASVGLAHAASPPPAAYCACSLLVATPCRSSQSFGLEPYTLKSNRNPDILRKRKRRRESGSEGATSVGPSQSSGSVAVTGSCTDESEPP